MSDSSDEAAGMGCGCLIIIALGFVGYHFIWGKSDDSPKLAEGVTELNPREPSAPANVTPATVPLPLAIDRGLIGARITGEDFYSVYIELTLLTEDLLDVRLAPGMALDPLAPGFQPMVVAGTHQFSLSPEKPIGAAHVDVASLSTKGKMATKNESLALAPARVGSEVGRLVDLSDFGSLDARERQLAIWAISDGLKLGGHKNQNGELGIKDGPLTDEVDGIRKLCVRAKIDTSEFPLFEVAEKPAPPPPVKPPPSSMAAAPAPARPKVEGIFLPGLSADDLYERWNLEKIGFQMEARPGDMDGTQNWLAEFSSDGGRSYRVIFKGGRDGGIFEIGGDLVAPQGHDLDSLASGFFTKLTEIEPLEGEEIAIQNWIKGNVGANASREFGDLMLQLNAPSGMMRVFKISRRIKSE